MKKTLPRLLALLLIAAAVIYFVGWNPWAGNSSAVIETGPVAEDAPADQDTPIDPEEITDEDLEMIEDFLEEIVEAVEEQESDQ